jgi:hypothetical protein
METDSQDLQTFSLTANGRDEARIPLVKYVIHGP